MKRNVFPQTSNIENNHCCKQMECHVKESKYINLKDILHLIVITLCKSLRGYAKHSCVRSQTNTILIARISLTGF